MFSLTDVLTQGPRHHHIRGPILPFYAFNNSICDLDAGLVHRCMVRHFVALVKSKTVRPVWQDVKVKEKCLSDCLKPWSEASSDDEESDDEEEEEKPLKATLVSVLPLSIWI